jgi:hypothetical protein
METAAIRIRNCWICGAAISPEMCKVDCHGLPVHGACLSAVLAFGLDVEPAQRLDQTSEPDLSKRK